MAAYKESIHHQGKPNKNGFRSWAKAQMNRLLRRLAKQSPADAPKKIPKSGYRD